MTNHALVWYYQSMIKIVAENNSVRVENASNDFLRTLELKYSWFDCINLNNRVLFFSAAQKCGYLGLTHVIADELKEKEIPYQLSFGRNEQFKGKHQEWKFTGSYRIGQKEAVEAVLEKRIGIVKAPPGTGKTCIMSAIVANTKGRTLILMERGEPQAQAVNAFGDFTNIVPTSYTGKEKKFSDVIVATVQTVSKAIDNKNEQMMEWLKDVDTILVDECHHVATDMYLKVLETIPNAKYCVGVSATPDDREDSSGNYVTASVGNVIYEIGYGTLIDHKVLVPVSIYVEKMPTIEDTTKSKGFFNDAPKTEHVQYSDIYEQYIINNTHRNQACANFVEDCIGNKMSVAVVVSRVEHAHALAKLIPQAEVLVSENKNRKEVIGRLKNKELLVVITTLFDEAVDVPSLDAVAVMAGGKSKIKLKQRIRSTRSFTGDTVYGHTVKKRGYVWIPYDQAKFIKSHSQKNIKELREIVAEHPLNTLEII